MNTEIAKAAMTTLVAMSQVPENFTATEIKKFYENIIAKLPCLVVWKDKDFKYVFCNEITAVDFLKLSSPNEIIGKTDFDLSFNFEAAKSLRHVDEEIVKTGKPALNIETTFEMSDGKIMHLSTNRMPLFDSAGEVIGILGVGVDITAQKEAEQLKLESQHQQVVLEEQAKFKKAADKVAHDIRSPLATVLMIVKACEDIPEKQRVALREAANSIGDIANNLLSKYRKKETDVSNAPEEREAILVSPLLLQMLTDKKYQYENLSIKFDHHFSEDGNFAWIEINPTVLKRMVSNVINNAVEAFDQKEGQITLHLDAHHNKVTITIEDNGKGMTPELVQKIMSHQAVTQGKDGGYGIGLTQVREALQDNHGELHIDSHVGVGTKMILTFPRVPASDWIAEIIQLNDDDTIVILDDDISIHPAWDTRFDAILKECPQLTVKHFSLGQEAIDFINGLSPDEKQKVFLLTDYELLHQNMNGVSVIKETQIQRAILVTSHYANKTVRKSIDKSTTRILPKQLASDIPITIAQVHMREQAQDTHKALKKVDAVFVDDDIGVLNGFTFFSHGKEVDTYHDPQQFLDSVPTYDRQTNIILDYHFDGFHLEGIQIAAQLHSLGFKRLYLLSGAVADELKTPHYLTLILKTDLDKVSSILNDN